MKLLYYQRFCKEINGTELLGVNGLSYTCELGVTLQTANATAKQSSQWQLERVEGNEANW